MKLILWDFDGTLAFRKGMWSGALAEVARSYVPGCSAVREDFAPHLQSGFPWHSPQVPHTHITSGEQWWHELSPVLGAALAAVATIPLAHAKQLVPRVRETYLDSRHWRLFEDVVPCLQALTRNGWSHVVLSNHVPELPSLVESLGLGSYVAATFTSALLGYE
ncbi:MAG: haloacid dehalogenase, partial [Burkholderiales bacterium]